MRLESAFRALLLARYPQAPHVAAMVTLHAMQASFPEPRSPAEQAAHEAYDMLKAAILDGRIALEGCLDGHLCGPIGAAEITTSAQINVFGSTVHIRHGRTYHDVFCSDDVVAALIDQPLLDAVALSGKRVYVPAVEACGDLIVKNRHLSKGKIWELAEVQLPGIKPGELDFAWDRYATEDQKRGGRRKETAVLKHRAKI
jgi:hypothetical protein